MDQEQRWDHSYSWKKWWEVSSMWNSWYSSWQLHVESLFPYLAIAGRKFFRLIHAIFSHLWKQNYLLLKHMFDMAEKDLVSQEVAFPWIDYRLCVLVHIYLRRRSRRRLCFQSRLSVCLSVCLFVCLLAAYRPQFCFNVVQNFRQVSSLPTIEMIKFWTLTSLTLTLTLKVKTTILLQSRSKFQKSFI